MRVRDILTNNYLKNQKLRQKEVEQKKTSENSPADAVSKSGSDTTQISDKARELQQSAQLIQDSVEILKKMPSIREDAVALARDRVESGYYQQPKVLDEVANIIGEHLSANSPLSASDLATDVIANVSPGQANLTKSDLLNIRKNLEQGVYESSEVVNKVADKIYQFLSTVKTGE